MKRGKIALLVLVLLVSLSLTALASATIFSDIWGHITGHAVSSVITCSDTDGGLNYYVKGSISWSDSYGNYNFGPDYCVDSTKLAEGYCYPGNTLPPQVQYALCPYGCYNGACLSSGSNITNTTNTISCSDTDGGLNYYSKGSTNWIENGESHSWTEYCMDNTTLRETYCPDSTSSPQMQNAYCTYGCLNGACQQQTPSYTITCSDSDNGIDYSTKGVASWSSTNGSSGSLADSCTGSSTIAEAYCVNSSALPKIQYSTCQYGCSEGTCLSQPSVTTYTITCSDSDNGLDYSAKGTVYWSSTNGTSASLTDHCLNSNTVTESYCPTSSSLPMTTNYYCTYGCSDGICLSNSVTFTNNTTITENNTIINNTLNNNTNATNTTVISGITCTDTDNGFDYYTQGATYWANANGYYYFGTDSCVNSTTLTEYYCPTNTSVPTAKLFVCAYGCSNGVCGQSPAQNQTPTNNQTNTGGTGNLTCDGCRTDTCYPFGYRQGTNYCSAGTSSFVPQLSSGATCNNNFECGSNLCLNNQCVSQSLLQQIIDWLLGILGFGKSTDVTSCMNITSSGNYVLQNDLAPTAVAPCINIHDTSNVNFDCQGKTITINYADGSQYPIKTAFTVNNVTGFSLSNCVIKTGLTVTQLAYPLSISNSDHGTVEGSTFLSYASVNLSNTSNTQFLGNNFTRSLYMQTYGTGNLIANNTFNWSQTGLEQANVWLTSTTNTTIFNNTMDGTGTGVYQKTHTGLDDNIALFKETGDNISWNTFMNTNDCAIESVYPLIGTTISHNSLKNHGYCGIGGWYYSGWKNNVFSFNTFDNVGTMFTMYRLYPLQSGETNVYFTNNLFEGNVLLGLNQYRGYAMDITMDHESIYDRIPHAAFINSNASFKDNDFDSDVIGPSIIPASMIVDLGGNRCNPSTLGPQLVTPLNCSG